MSTDELDHWLEALAGRDPAGASEEGRSLRAQIRAQPAEILGALAKIDPAREAELIARARTAGLLPTGTPIPPRARSGAPGRLGLRRMALVAAALAGVAIGVTVLREPLSPTPTERASANGAVEILARDPHALKQSLIVELKAAGVDAVGYERLDRSGVDADLPVPLTPQVRRVLEQHDIPVPSDGVLAIEIRASGAR